MTDAYLPRAADAVLSELLSSHPAVTVTGPRATGKTTTAARLVQRQLRLANPAVRTAVQADPVTALVGPEPVLVDEWQLVPDVLSAIKEEVDARPRRGRFVVTGSARGELDSPMWPGTGRLVPMRMYGLTEREIERRVDRSSWLASVLSGEVVPADTDDTLRTYVERALASGFPEARLQLAGNARLRWLSAYVEQVVMRDVDLVGGVKDPFRLRRYLEALALNTAGVVDDVTLIQAAGVAKETARRFERLLTNLYVIEPLPAWTSNRLKRLVLAPKRFLVDTGLVAGVLGLTTEEVMLDGNLLGRILETFVVGQVRAELALMAAPPRMHHLRTESGRHEIDLVIEIGARRLVAIEIKATSAPSANDARHLVWFREQMGASVRAAVLLHTGPTTFPLAEGVWAVPIAALWS
ncbi:MAG: ATP-binding protein [Actinomycetes bacterium]